MLEITIPAGELWDEIHNEFITTKEQKLKLEHSLVSQNGNPNGVSRFFLKNRKPVRKPLTILNV